MLKWFAFALAAVAIIAFASWRLVSGPQSPTVVVYVSHDQVFSEPILKDFEKETRVRVRAIYDTEETKSTGAMNRLIAEKNNPQDFASQIVSLIDDPARRQVMGQFGRDRVVGTLSWDHEEPKLLAVYDALFSAGFVATNIASRSKATAESSAD